MARTLTQPPAQAAGRLARTPAGVLVLASIGSVQFGSALAATLFERLHPGGVTTLRLSFAAVILLAIWRPRVRAHTRHELSLAVVFGLVLAAMNLTFYEALHRIPLGIAVALEFVGPLAVAVSGSRHRIDALWVLLAAAGILALTGHAGAHALNPTGVALALIAGGLWGTYILVNARLGQAFAGGGGLALAMTVGAVAIIPFGVGAAGARLLTPESLALGAAVGVLSSVIPYSFELEALRRMATSVFGVLMSLEPAMAALAGFLVLGQSLEARDLLGIALVIVASIGASRRRKEPPVAV